MGNKETPGERPGESVNNSRRSFFKTVGAGAVLLAASNFGVGSFSKAANAQDQFVQIAGQNVKIAKLTEPLAKLDRETQKYRTGDGAGETFRPDGSYGLSIVVPEEVAFLVTLHAVKKEGGTVSSVEICFPKERDSPTVPEDDRGTRGKIIDDFNSLAKKISKQEVNRVQIILEKSKFDYNGNTATLYNAYILPVDALGNKTTSMGPGKYLAYHAGYFYYNGGADGGGAGPVLLVDPSAAGPLARR